MIEEGINLPSFIIGVSFGISIIFIVYFFYRLGKKL